MTAGDEEASNGLKELIKKTESSLLPAIEEHVRSTEFAAKKDGLDFLHVKNSLLTSYLIELVLYTRGKARGEQVDLTRLIELKTALEKIRPLEKKMRYQLEKLLSANTDSSTFASSDPLSFRPNPESLKEEQDDGEGLSLGDSDCDDDDDDHGDAEQEEGSDDEADMDDDLEAAKATIQLAKKKTSTKNDDEDSKSGVYKAPRMTAMPYKPETDHSEKDKRLQRRMRTTELAQALKEQFSEAPEQDDFHGGSAYGKQKEAARRLAQRETEKTNFEEQSMMRLTTTRKEKKDQKRMMREESSNLSAISDLGNIVRGVREAFGDDGARGRKRSGGADDFEEDAPKAKARKKKGGIEAKNTFQKALFAGDSNKSKKKKGKR